jgi:dethiobiotin synthetase
MRREKVYFVSGIDTDAGKSYATGWLAARWRAEGASVITQKLVQTGCAEGAVSEDIATHRRLMGTGLLPEDRDHTTCPLRFALPASPDLAARMEGRTVDLALADRATAWLSERYDTVLVEGAGGLLVSIDGFYTMADYVAERGLPLILVTSPRLGSVNHTLLSLEACRTRGIRVAMLAYNLHGATSPEITKDTSEYFKKYIKEFNKDCEFLEIPVVNY